MPRRVQIFVLAALLLSGSCSLSFGPAVPRRCDMPSAYNPPTGYWTAHEAYELVRPAILAWHDDAMLNYVSPGGQSESVHRFHPDWTVRADGTAPKWTFSVVSPGAGGLVTHVTFSDGHICVGIDGFPSKEIRVGSLHDLEKGIPMDQVIGSDQAVAIVLSIAQEAKMEDLYSITLSRTPLLWTLVFKDPTASAESFYRTVEIDALGGAVLRNDFSR